MGELGGVSDDFEEGAGFPDCGLDLFEGRGREARRRDMRRLAVGSGVV